jgi:alkylated DNA repair dioxygenase AlkB
MEHNQRRCTDEGGQPVVAQQADRNPDESNIAPMPITIPGLTYVPEFITPDEEAQLIEEIDRNDSVWRTELKRRVQHYWYIYPYRSRRRPTYIGPLPDWLGLLAKRVQGAGFMGQMADQAIVNEYKPGQNISRHVDRPYFGDEIASLSLGSTCVIVFHSMVESSPIEIFLERCSLLVLAGEARESWLYEIPKRKTDVRAGEPHPRGRRLSITLRTVLPE